MSDKDSTPGTDSPPASGASPVEPAAGASAATPPSTPASTPGLPDLEAHAEAPQWLSGDIGHDTGVWSAAFEGAESGPDGDGKNPADPADPDVAGPAEPSTTEATDTEATDTKGTDTELGDAEAAAPAAEDPVLTNPDDLTLEEPSLASPDISSDAADAASLNDATAEVKAVEAEAADAAVLTDPAANHPAAVSHTEGIAAAAPMTDKSAAAAETTPDETPETDEPAKPDADGGELPGSDEAAKPESGAGPGREAVEAGSAKSAPAGSPDSSLAPAEPADSRRSRRDAESPAASSEPASGNGTTRRNLLIIGALGVFAVLVVLFFTVVLGSEKAPGVLEENVAPIELDAGACLADFTGVNEPATVVTCDTPHNAQLVAAETYPDSDEFPGTDALSERATEVCSQVRYSEALTESPDLELQENKAVPTPESWDDGDRRIDCFVVSSGEEDLTESLLAD